MLTINTDKSNTQHSFRTAEAQSFFGQLDDFGIGVRKIGFVGVVGDKALVAIFALVALFAIAILPTFDD